MFVIFNFVNGFIPFLLILNQWNCDKATAEETDHTNVEISPD